jgi:hypothetical protein
MQMIEADVPADVEKRGAALLTLSRYARGVESTKGKQRHGKMYHIHRDSDERIED